MPEDPTIMSAKRTRGFLASLAALTLVFSTVAIDYAEARRGGGSFGSRGGRTFQSAPATNTAPAAAPVQRSTTTPGQANQAGAPAAGAAAGAAARPGLFGGGMGGALMRGLLIGGLFGLFMGTGFGGLAGFIGLLVQGALIALLVWFVIRLFRRRSGQPSMAGPQGNMAQNRTMYEANNPNARPAGMTGAGGGARAASQARGQDVIGIKPADLDTFESRLKDLQSAYGRADYDTLDRIATPEMVSYLAEEIAANEAKGLQSEAGDVRLEQGDVAESWREGDREYATVAMRYSMAYTLREKATGRVVEGGDGERVESTEIWTFLRERGGEWKLSAIQS